MNAYTVYSYLLETATLVQYQQMTTVSVRSLQ